MKKYNNTMYTTVSAESSLFYLSALIDEKKLSLNLNTLSITFFVDRSQKEEIDNWDSSEWLEKLFNKEEDKVKDFKKFIKDNYSVYIITPKRAYKEFRTAYKLIKKL